MEDVILKAHAYKKIMEANHKMSKALDQVKELLRGVECRYTRGDLAILNSIKLINEAKNEQI